MGKDEAKIRRWDIMVITADSAARRLRFKELKDRFPNLSHQTIRNDLAAIRALPKFLRDASTGGLVARPNELSELFKGTYFGSCLEHKVDEKIALADSLVNYCDADWVDGREGTPLIDVTRGSIVVGPGSTTLEVLERLALHGPQIMTPNIGIFTRPSVMTEAIHLCGGWLHRDTGCLVGSEAASGIGNFVADTAIIGVSGLCPIDSSKGNHDVALYCRYEIQRPVIEALVRNRRKVIVVACSDAIGATDAWPFAKVREILGYADFYLVTEDLPSEIKQALTNSFKQLSSHPGKAGKGHEAKLIIVSTKETDQ